VAKGKDGKKFAVKVQHEGLKENSAGDMAAITYVVYLIPYWFKGVSYNWIADEMNANLPKELDFEEEKKNLEQCTANLSALISQGDVAIPTVVPSLSSKRVLTMSFEEGSYVSDLQSIRDMKVGLEDVSRLISTVFSEQTYRHGFVHCGR
jgi:aarF domain-containing kinase